MQTSDPNAGDTHVYALRSDPSGKFEIVGDEVRVRAGETIDFESDASFDITVRTTDPYGETHDQVLTLTVDDFEGSYTASDRGETVTGTSEEDVLTGGAGADTIEGGAGDDVIDGMGQPDSSISVGAGADVAGTADGDVFVWSGDGTAKVDLDTTDVDPNDGDGVADYIFAQDHIGDSTLAIHDFDYGIDKIVVPGDHISVSLTSVFPGAYHQLTLGYTDGSRQIFQIYSDSSGMSTSEVLTTSAPVSPGGAGGSDTAVWSGNLADFSVAYDSGTETFTITDLNVSDGDEGTDTVTGIESFTFGRSTYDRTALEDYAATGRLNSAPTDVSFTAIAPTETTLPPETVTVVSGEIMESGFQTSIDRWSLSHAGGDLEIGASSRDDLFDSKLILFRDNADGTFTEVASDDDSGAGFDPRLSLTDLPAGDYVLALGNYTMSTFEALDTSSVYSNFGTGGGEYRISVRGTTTVNGLATNPDTGGRWGDPDGEAGIVSTNSSGSGSVVFGGEVASAVDVIDVDAGDTHSFAFSGVSTSFEIDGATGSISLKRRGRWFDACFGDDSGRSHRRRRPHVLRGRDYSHRHRQRRVGSCHYHCRQLLGHQ